MRHFAPSAAFFAAFVAFFAMTLTAHAADDPATLKRKLQAVEDAIESGREKAHTLAGEVASQVRQVDHLRAEMQAAARAVQAHEGAVTRLERERAALRIKMADRRTSLAARRGELGVTLAALQRIALRPASALLVAPGDPNDIVRSGLLIRTAIPQIEARATRLRTELDELATLDARLGENKRELTAAGAALVDERAHLSSLVAAKNALLRETRDEQEAAIAHVEELRRKSRNLGELLEALMRRGEMRDAAPLPRPSEGAAALRGAAAPAAPSMSASPVSRARGRLTPPAQGEVLIAYGARNDFGATAHGVTWRTRPSAAVVAPWDGRVAFAGPFRHFGRILIIDHGEGYHSLIAGLAQIEARTGQWVLAGEPVGSTGYDQAALSGATGGGGPSQGTGNRTEGPTVYVEFRRNGQPINPLPWLAASLDRID